LMQVYLKNKAGALIGGILLLAFFLLKDGIWRYIQLFFLCDLAPLRKKENTLAKPAYRRQDSEPPRLFDFSLRLPSAGRSFLLCEKKRLAQSLLTAGRTQSRKGFTLLVFFAPAFRRQAFSTLRE
jgi:hypothetical protein